ncbi:carotenoid biosynthesis protein [Nocardia goodfellowii]|uniref:Membrane protein n=2 Tax=Nocardia goodfellowii TaxID=882446 RepID=A0ABS4QRN1_9NOCA|nr:putative membrane protein [Nocardia goodfellowii]
MRAGEVRAPESAKLVVPGGPVRAQAAVVVPMVFALLLVAVQISYPLTSGAGRDRVTVAVVLLSAATALAHAAVTRGWRYAAGLLVILSGIGLLAEVVGIATGFPFGCYEYAVDRIGPAVAGVPLIVPVAWTGGLYPVWVVAGLLARTPAARVGLTAAGGVGWDLFLDPQMVADGQWRWCDAESGLPGLEQIPLTNYAGWVAAGLLMASLLLVWERVADRRRDPRPASVAVPVAVFLWTWLGSALAHAVFLGLPASAGYGAVGMGLLGIPLLGLLARSGLSRG